MNKIILLIFSLFLAPHLSAAPRPFQVSISPKTLTLNGTFKGIGAQDDTHMLWDNYNDNTGVNVPYDFTNILAPRLRTMKMPFVRKFVRIIEFAPSPGVYTWKTDVMKGLYLTLQTLKEVGTDIVFTSFRLPTWLAADQSGFPDPGKEQQWAVVMADFFEQLHRLGFTNAKYFVGPNELEGTTVPGLTLPYTLLRQQLDARGLSSIVLLGPDMYSFSNTTQVFDHSGFQAITAVKGIPSLNSLIGIYDWHAYLSGYSDFTGELGMLALLQEGINTAVGTNKQVWISEFGNVWVKNTDWPLTPLFVIHAVNSGHAAVCIWELLDMTYGEGLISGWGLISSQHEHYANKLSYYAYTMMTSHVKMSSEVLQNNCTQMNCPDLRVSVFKSPTNENTIFAYNLNASQSKAVEFKYLRSTNKNQVIYRYLLNPAAPISVGRNAIPYDKVINMVDGKFTDTIPAKSFAVYYGVNGELKVE